MRTRRWLWMHLALAALAATVWAAPAAAPPATQSAPATPDKLAAEERLLADKFQQLEDKLLRMAELGAAGDLRRTALLRKAVAQSKGQLIGVRFGQLVDILGKDELSKALENQTALDQDLHSLLELLLTENRAKSIESEKARIREYLRAINAIIRQEKDIQARTAAAGNAKGLAGEQGKVAEKTGDLAGNIRKNEEGKAGAPKEEKDNGGNEQGGKNQGAEDKGAKNEGGQGKNEQSGESSGGRQPSQQNPARSRLESARKRMREAQKKLEEVKHQDAVAKQEEAVRELEQAKAALEEILRQLREEEIERLLALLETRFQKMLQMQEAVYEGTLRLDKVPEAQRTHSHEIEAGRLSSRQSQIVVEVDKAAVLLREDGTAVAFPEAVDQMRDDMRQVVTRLAQAKVGKITQNIEEDILAALRDMIESLKKARKGMDSRPKPGEAQSGQPQDPPLVDLLSELKMIRALQMRVNARTQRYSQMILGEQADNAELVEAIRRLAEREQRIYRVTRDLQMGKNQ
jgi:hypothetical protein